MTDSVHADVLNYDVRLVTFVYRPVTEEKTSGLIRISSATTLTKKQQQQRNDSIPQKVGE
jgi:hypothetical protein